MTNANGSVTAEETVFPLVVTLDTERHACVSGATLDGRWMRPEPVEFDEVSGKDPLYQFFRPVTVGLSASRATDARPEDRHIARPAAPAGSVLTMSKRGQLLEKVADPSVEEAFAGLRSVGVVRAHARRIYRQRSTGGKRFVRLAFNDATGAEYDWIIRDVRFLAPFPDPQHPDAEDWLEGFGAQLAAHAFYMAIGLTKPTGRFPGQFRGCHPLVAGVHGATEQLLQATEVAAHAASA